MVKINHKKLIAKYKKYKAGADERRKAKVAKLEYKIKIAKLRAEKRKYAPKPLLGGTLGASIGGFAKEVKRGYGIKHPTTTKVRRKTKKKRKKR